MLIQKYLPNVLLSDYITGYYFINDGGLFIRKGFTGIPLGHHTLFIFNYNMPVSIQSRSYISNCNDYPFFCSYLEGPCFVKPEKEINGVVVDFTSYGFKNIFSVPATEHTGTVLFGQDIIGKELSFLFEQLDESKEIPCKVEVLDNFLLRRFKKSYYSKKFNLVFNEILIYLYANAICKRISDIRTKSGYSKRYFEKCIKDFTGTSAKTLSRIVRANKAFEMLNTGESWSDIICKLNYYDQTHFIKEIKWLTGKTPGRGM